MPVELNVRSELNRIIAELAQIHDAAGRVGDDLGNAGKQIGDGLEDKAKKTETFLERLRSMGGRVADQLVKDFKALASINALAGSLKFSEMFRGSIKETVTLSDTIRKLSAVLGIAGNQAARFQTQMTKALAASGLSSAAGANALTGLSGTAVRGGGNLIAYAQTAGMLASVSRQKGSEGEISAGLGRVVTARGGNVNDISQMRSVADDVLRIRHATGKSATEILSSMDQLFSGANQAFQKRLQGGGAVSLAAAALIGGQGATSFLERYLHSNVFQRFGSNAQGLGGIVGANGALNLPAMQAVLKSASGRGLGDAQAGLTTMGLSDEEAKGFIRLTQAMEQNQAAVDGARTQQVSLNKEMRDSLTLGEAFSRTIDNTKAAFSGATSGIAPGLTDFLTKAGDSTAGSMAVAAGSGVLAALLTGGGIRGIAKAAGVEAATGREVQPVFVTNFPASFGAGDALGGLAKGGGIAGALGTAGLIGAGVAVGTAVIGAGLANENRLSNEALAPLKRADAYDTEQKQLLKDINASLQQIKVVDSRGKQMVDVRLNTSELKTTKPPSRGGNFGP